LTTKLAEHYIISLFSRDKKLTAKQLELIGVGRRTPSILYTIERKQLFSLYGLFPKWNEKMWMRIINDFTKRKWLIVDNGEAFLSEEGERQKTAFIMPDRSLPDIKSIEYAKTRSVFWERFVFISQILSEFSYNNNQYLPHLPSAEDQRQTKLWIKQQGLPMKELTRQWAEEIASYLESLPVSYANMLVDQLMGNEENGLTRRQLLEKFAMTESDYKVLMTHLLESFRLYSLNHDLALIQNLWSSIHVQESKGLNKSAYETLHLIEMGHTIDEIARLRHLKENTIIEHLLEIVLVTHWPGYKAFIPDDAYAMIHHCFEDKPDLTYGEFKLDYPDIPFFWFRLIEIERIRAHAY